MASLSVMATSMSTSMSATGDVLREFAKIIQFREDIVSGNHGHIKLPSHSSHSTKQNSSNVFRPSQSNPVASTTTSDQHHIISPPSATLPPMSPQPAQPAQPALKHAASAYKTSGSGSFPAVSQRPAATAGSKARAVPTIDPVLLEKSDDLKNAEIRLQRIGIERQLREEVEQRRGKVQGSDEMPDFDLSEVLMKALQRVQAAALPGLPDSANTPAAANAAPSSDSFDDNTFYSSQHDTPESTNSARQQPRENDDIQMGDDSSYEPQISEHIPSYPPPVPQPGPGPVSAPSAQQHTMSGALGSHVIEVRSSQESGEASGSRGYNSNGTDQNADSRRGPLQPAFEPREAQLIRAHNLSPVAPQPAHIPSLLFARTESGPEQGRNVARGAPAQVAALRGDPSGANTSPESSPQTGTNRAEKRKAKKKKRKAERQVPEPLSPFIKPEPRSASPPSVPAYARPSKRQRQNEGARPIQVQDLTGDEARYEPVEVGLAQPERYPSRQYREERYTIAYDDPRRPPAASVVRSPRPERALLEERRPAAAQLRQPRSPGTYVQYTEAPIQRSVSRATQAFYREAPEDAPRISTRPDALRERSRSPVMGPPRPARIIVDQYGREYIDPPRPTVIRQSVPPGSRHGDADVIYERTVPREQSRRPELFDDRVIYTRRASPTYTVPRRVMTQPEFAPATEYRSYRQGEYAGRPAGVAEEYIVRTPVVERRFEEALPREFITRAASVRPAAAEPVRYEMARGDFGRVQSVRPEAQLREYPPSAPPIAADGRRSVIQQPTVIREFRSHSDEQQQQPLLRQEFIRPPVEERYYESRAMRNSGEGIAFIERPGGATQEIVYADDVRRGEVYR